jgi:hypothetical protein
MYIGTWDLKKIPSVKCISAERAKSVSVMVILRLPELIPCTLNSASIFTLAFQPALESSA